MRYIGLDVHKDNITACVLTAQGKVRFEHDYKKRSQGWDCLSELLQHRDKDGVCFLMESGTYAYPPYRFLTDLGQEVHVIHARSLKMITETDKKTDRNDAQTIARMLRLWKRGDIELSMSFMPTREQCELKDICRYREEISRNIADETRRIKSHMSRNCLPFPEGCENFQVRKSRDFVLDAYPNDRTLVRRMHRLNDLFRERDEVQRDVESRLLGDERVDLLTEIPGIGRQTAVQLMSMIVDIERFPDPERFCSFFGMVPKVGNSGGKVHIGKMTKHGDRMMREIMERVTLTHVQNCESSITDFYNRLAPRMGKKKALVAASRKMLSVIYSVLKRGTHFRPHPSD